MPKKRKHPNTKHPQSYYVGEKATNHKLTRQAVRDIRANYAPVRGRSTYAFARKYGVSQATILMVVRRDTWKGVEPTGKEKNWSEVDAV